MPLGRIKRNRVKVSKMLYAREKKVRVTVNVYRYTRGTYRAVACVGDSGRPGGARCSRAMPGRTPQSAIAKALKRLSSKIANRRR